MSKDKINIWGEIDETGLFATLRTASELLNEIDRITTKLVRGAVNDLESLDYDTLLDWCDTCSGDEFEKFQIYFAKDYRLSEVIRIELKRRNN